jgi:hypothetical protein
MSKVFMMVFDGLNCAQAAGLSSEVRAIKALVAASLVKSFKINPIQK